MKREEALKAVRENVKTGDSKGSSLFLAQESRLLINLLNSKTFSNVISYKINH
jgi:hypothetical protein